MLTRPGGHGQLGASSYVLSIVQWL